MKQIMILPAAILALAACNSRPANQYDINGTVDGADGETVYLQYMVGDSTVKDSTCVANGKFAFTGNIERPTMAIVYIGEPSYQNKALSQFYVEPAEITVSGLKADDFSGAVFAGSKSTDEMKGYEATVKPLADEMTAMRGQMESATEEEAPALHARYDSIADAYKAKSFEFIKENPGSYWSAYLIRFSTSELPFEELKTVYESLTPEVQEAAKEVGEELAAMEAVQPGKPAPDLVGVNPEGKETKLSDLKGKVVLIDFWATWCKPCRAGLPHVKALYDKYHDKGLEVFCVADNDGSEDLWKKVIVDEDMEGYHNILRGLKKNEKTNQFDRSNDQSAKYAVHYIPTKYLIDRDGNIIFKVENDEQLDSKLAELFN